MLLGRRASVRKPAAWKSRCVRAAATYTSLASQKAPGAKRPRALLISGRAMANDILTEVRREVEVLKDTRGFVPGLATILVGERKDSEKYVQMKHAVAQSVGFQSFSTVLPNDARAEDVLAAIYRYNVDQLCHGILLQLPLPSHLDPRSLLGAIRVEKDVECFHPMNTGRLTCWRETVIAPCTPRAVMEMLSRLGVPLHGRKAVVLGESNVVGLPMALMLNAARATVSMVHKDTPDPEFYVRNADLVIAAVGVPELVKKDWIKPGAVVIDVGINFVRDSSRPEGFRMVGDVSPCVRSVASIVSPVPGGVGPMTVAMVCRNTIDMALLRGKWRHISDPLHTGHAQENARRIQGSVLDMGWGVSHQGLRNKPLSTSVNGGDSTAVGVDKGQCQQEMRVLLEQAGAGITDAELLTIANDSERNAHNIISFFELGQMHDRSLGESNQEETKEDRCKILEDWKEEVRNASGGKAHVARAPVMTEEDELVDNPEWWKHGHGS